VWLARGRHVGSGAHDLLCRRLRQQQDSGAIRAFLELPPAEDSGDRVFEARWEAGGGVTVRARLTLTGGPGDDGAEREWVLAAEAEAAWDPRWPSPATVFWPEAPGTGWDHAADAGLRLRHVNALPEDDKDLRRVLRAAARDSWAVHVVVHEAMTPDARGLLPLTRLMPPGLRHLVVEHRAAPQQLRKVNYALREFGVEVPRGGAVVLPGAPAAESYDAAAFCVRTVFLDGSEPAELSDAVRRFAASARPLPRGADTVLAALRDDWHLLTLEEELDRQRALVAMYAEALEAMTRSRDLYREAAERAHEALAAYRESAGDPPPQTSGPTREAAGASPLQQLTRTLDRLRTGRKSARPALPAPAQEAPGERTDTVG
jgi:hypothetical protein